MTATDTQAHRFRELEAELSLARWLARRSYAAERFCADELLALKRESVSIVLPARNVARTIGPVLDVTLAFRECGLVDEVLVVDAASADGTAELAAARGACVQQESELMSERGPAKGKGDAMWRGVAASTGEIVLFLDTDTEDFSERFVLGLLGPLLVEPEVQFVKGSFRRPYRVGEVLVPDGGGRVTELVARPLLNLYVPELAGFVQPLAGETAARRRLLESLAFPVGYGIEIAMMIDSLRLLGIDAMAQVDLGIRQNRHQPLRDLSVMAYSVLIAASTRIHGIDAVRAHGPGALALPSADGVEVRHVALEERPALKTLSLRDTVSMIDPDPRGRR